MSYQKQSQYPSVTEILSPYSGYDQVPDNYLTIAAERGTLVHSYCAAIAKKEWAPDLNESCRGYVESFRRWFDAFVDDVLLVEEELEDPALKYCGHPDLLIRSSALGGVILPDLKTPKAVKTIWGAQLAAYDNLIKRNMNIESHRIGSLQLSESGKMAVFDEFTEFRGSYFAAFYGALIAHNFFKKAA
jgi:hypothetical protein